MRLCDIGVVKNDKAEIAIHTVTLQNFQTQLCATRTGGGM
jgi:hypothetical protein